MESEPQVYLNSGSPRRRELLAQIGVSFEVLSAEVDEVVGVNESAEDYVKRVTLDKARAGWNDAGRILSIPVLASDTEVVLDGQVQGKPQDREHGLAMLQSLSGRCHEVLSAVAVRFGEREQVVLTRHEVCFDELSLSRCEKYWETGEPIGKAGGYAVQGRAAVFIRDLRGSFSGVMGLPLYETALILADFGVDCRF